MSVPRVLWLAMLVPAIPLLLETTTGCGFSPSGTTNVDEFRFNSYAVECECGEEEEVNVQVVDDLDDAEEDGNFNVDVGDDVLDLENDPTDPDQGRVVVGVRFQDVSIPQGAKITEAYIQFTADDDEEGDAAYTIYAEQAHKEPDDDAAPFDDGVDKDLRNRIDPTSVTQDWTPGPWESGSAGEDQRTPNLAALVQEVVNQGGWEAGKAMVFLFEDACTDRCDRDAVSYDGDPDEAARLRVTYRELAVPLLNACLPEELNPNNGFCEKDPSVRCSRDGQCDLAGDSGPCIDLPPDPKEEPMRCSERLEKPCSGDGDCEADEGSCVDLFDADVARIQQAVTGMADVCGYPSNCSCRVVPSTQDGEFGRHNAACTPSAPGETACTPMPVDPECSNFDPTPPDDPTVTATHAGVCTGNPGNFCKTDDECPDGDGPCVFRDSDAVCVAEENLGNSGSSFASFAATTGGRARPLAAALFGQRSLCEVSGPADIDVGGRSPEGSPSAAGTIEFTGRPCPGDTCFVGISFELDLSDIEFDRKFKKRDPRFEDLNAVANSAPSAAEIGILGGVFPEGSTLGTASGRRGGDTLGLSGANSTPLLTTVDWSNFTCSLDGDLAALVDAEERFCAGGDGTKPCENDSPDCDDVGGPCLLDVPDEQELTALVMLDGPLLNQPPTAVAGKDQIVECTSPTGASFTLDGSGSSDPDGNIALARWLAGSRIGPVVGVLTTATAQLGVGDTETYVLRVIDAFAQADEDETRVEVEDSTPPEIACNAPATIDPTQGLDEDEPDKAPVSFVATATDVCDASVPATIVSFDCFKESRNGKRVDKTESCVISIADDTITILNSGGVGDRITWQVLAVDDSGNESAVECGVDVVRRPKP